MQKCLKKVTCIVLLAVLVVTNCMQGNVQIAQAATKESLKKKLQTTTSVPIRKFIYEDLNRDEKKEAIAITSREVDELGYINATIWYLTDASYSQVESCDGWAIYPGSIKKYKVKNTWILTFDAGAGGSGWFTYAYSFDRQGANRVENVGVGLTYLGKNQFAVSDSQYDACTDGSGHTWNQYYSKWDGEKLVEYGGLKISQNQLKKTKNGATILNQIKKKGSIGDIYYRANGLIFVNYQSGDQNYNVTLKIKDGKVSYDTQNEYGKTRLEKATQSGVIHKNITSCVRYPKSFPVK